MPCALPKQAELRFMKSGIRILPYKLDTETPYHWMSNAQAKISREAGELIKSNHLEAEPVMVLIDGTPQDRYYFRSDSVTLDHEQADLVLWDALKVLDRGIIQEQFPSATLQEIIAYIINHRDDPNSVITGVANPGDTISQQETGDFLGESQAFTAKQAAKGNDLAVGVRNTIEGIVEGAADFLRMDIQKGGVYIKQESPWSAIQKTMGEFSFTPWVDADGLFHYASPGAGTGNQLQMSVGTDAFKLAEYNLFPPKEKPISTRIRGTYKTEGIVDLGGLDDSILEGVYPIGEAHYQGEATQSVAETEPRDLHSLKAVGSAASRSLNDEWMKTNSGNFVINSAASKSKRLLAGLRSGDVVTVDGELDNCNKRDRVIDGGYIVHNVQHKVDQEVGWQTTIEVSLLPPPIVVNTYTYVPRTGVRYEDLQDYKHNNPTGAHVKRA